jgi:D-serine deaminase-like pyridoxal phosphate-dependent protein
MLLRASNLGCTLRPHVKTHKTIQGALMQTNNRFSSITVSTLAEAEFFIKNGFTDVLYAVPIDPFKIPRAAKLAKNKNTLLIMVDSIDQLQHLLSYGPPSPRTPWNLAIMVDSGYGRDGVAPSSQSAIDLAKAIESNPDVVKLGMLYTHGGHSYDVPHGDINRIKQVSTQERNAVTSYASSIRSNTKLNDFVTGVGSTPSCSHPPSHLDGVQEMHPGNYFAYDVNQALIGSCTLDDIAVRVLTRVVGHYPGDVDKLQIDCGWTGCSQQGAAYNYGVIGSYGEVGSKEQEGLIIENLKQEAGTVRRSDSGKIDFDEYPIGKIMEILPWHSCAAVHQHRVINVIENGGDEIKDVWNVCDGW